MRGHYPLLTILSLTAVVVLSPAHVWARHHDDPAKLREQIERERNPVKKAKLEIRLARVDLEQGLNAYDQNHIRRGQRLLDAYVQTMNESWNLLKGSGRNAVKNPSGFMQLEIALRENARLLNDLEQRVTYLEQSPIRKTLGAMNRLHAHVLMAIFPGAAPPRVTVEKRPKTGASAFASKEPHP
jgi:hypothetical protein